MKILVWNCRGLGTPAAIRSLKDVVQTSCPQILGLIETKTSVAKWQRIRSILGFQHCFAVPSRGSSGGLALLWKTDTEVSVNNFSFYHVDFTVSYVIEFRSTLFYGSPNASLRHHSWDLITRLNTMSNLPWCLFGDFNEIMKYSKTTGQAVRRSHLINQFQSVVRTCDLSDLGYQGPPFTYSNRRRGAQEVRCRLDRALANSGWRLNFPTASVTHLVAHHSDHCPIVIHLENRTRCTTKTFRFESMWMRDSDFSSLVENVWSSTASTTSSFADKISKLSNKLQYWNKHSFGNVTLRLQKLKAELVNIRQRHRSPVNIQKEQELMRQLDEWLHREEIMWSQRARISWLTEGDNNTRFFHARANIRNRNNTIIRLQKFDGSFTSVPHEMIHEGVRYFRNLFSSQSQLPEPSLTEMLALIPAKVTEAHNMALLSPYSVEEVTTAVFQLHPSKAPGLDGFPTLFYHKFWTQIKDNFIHGCLQFLNHGILEEHINDTLIILIPKQKQAQKMEQYRPISLSGVMAKTISKVLTNRLQRVLPDVISPSQSALIKDRSISDNFLIAHETSHYIQNQAGSKGVYGSLKLDMSKAFDRLEWKYLKLILLQLGFHID